MLRTGFANTNDENYPFAMITYDRQVARLPWEDDQRLSNKRAAQDHKTRLALEVLHHLHRPAWRLVVVRKDRDSFLQFSALHALYDATALQIIFSNVARYYAGQKETAAMAIDPALGTILSSSNADVERQKEFWQRNVQASSNGEFPRLDPTRTDSDATLTIATTCSFSTSRIERDCRDQGLAILAVGQAAWARLVSAYTGDESVTFGTVLSGRLMSTDAEEVVFPCITTLPLSCTLNDSNESLVRAIMDSDRCLLEQQFTPLSRIQRLTGHTNRPLFNSIFAFQKLPAKERPSHPWTMVEEAATADVRLEKTSLWV